MKKIRNSLPIAVVAGLYMKGELGMPKDLGSVWLAVAGWCQDEMGRWLVVKKKYGGLKGKWSLPAGFVQKGETVDQAVVREVKEETGIDTVVNGLVGLRTGVLHDDISDNLLIFSLTPQHVHIQKNEVEMEEVQWIDPEDLLQDRSASIILHELIKDKMISIKKDKGSLNPGNHFRYKDYKLFL